MMTTMTEQEKGILNSYTHLMTKDWLEFLKPFLLSDHMRRIEEGIKDDKSKGIRVLPKTHNVFNAFRYTPSPDDVKCVMLGMDPYNRPGQPIGLSFAVNLDHTSVPGSLRMIDKEIEKEYTGEDENDREISERTSGQLQEWTDQGVLLLNAALTVREGEPGSHIELWKPFTEYVIRELSKKGAVFLLMGRKAQYYEKYINSSEQIVKAPHPAAELWSGGNAGFLGSDAFLDINTILMSEGREPIIWYKRYSRGQVESIEP